MQCDIRVRRRNGEGHMEKKIREKIWNIRYVPGDAERDNQIKLISDKLGISEILGALLHSRGYTTPPAAERFLKNEESVLHDPFLLKDIEPAVERIRRAVAEREKIIIYGDYDVDGVTAVSLIYLYLRAQEADVDYYIPSRSGEGYGLSLGALESLGGEGVGLIITVDTGITANEEVEYAKQLGIDMVITDHHECRPELPGAVAVVNPHRPDCDYPFRDLAGVGVVFKLLTAYEITRSRERGEADIDAVRRVCYEYADLVAIGTVADVMPITDENRLIVALGLRMIAETRRPGLAALINATTNKSYSHSSTSRPARRRKITSNFIGYGIAPRINAAGRISSATTAVRLLLAEDKDEAASLARELCEINTQRQIEENRIAEQAYKKIEREFDFNSDRVIVLEDDGWQQGIIGIVSSRITEKFGLPSVLISFDGSTRGYSSEDDTGKGSGRSIKGMNLVEALNACEDLLVKYGGHELAAGLTIERRNVPEFIKRINEYAKMNLKEEDMAVNLEADCVLSLDMLTLPFAAELNLLEPYGVTNPVPTFIAYDVTINKILPISSGKHLKLIIGEGGAQVTALYFNMPPSRFGLFEGERADILFTVDINEYQNVRSVQIIVQDIRMSRSSAEDRRAIKRRYEEISGGGTFSAEEDFIPDRDDFAAVYTMLRREFRLGRDALTDRMMLSLLSNSEKRCSINYVKLMYILKVFRELEICSADKIADGLFCFDVSYRSTKTNIEKSTILKKLRAQCRNRI